MSGANPILSRLAVSRNPSPLAAATAAPGVCLLRFAWESAAGSLVGAVVGYGNDTLVPFPVPVPVRLGFLRPVRREWLVLDSFNSILQFGVIYCKLAVNNLVSGGNSIIAVLSALLHGCARSLVETYCLYYVIVPIRPSLKEIPLVGLVSRYMGFERLPGTFGSSGRRLV